MLRLKSLTRSIALSTFALLFIVAALAGPARAQSDEGAAPDKKTKTPVAKLSVKPTKLKFSVNLDSSTLTESKSFVIKNTGTAALGDLAVGAPSNSAYTITSGTAPTTLPAAASTTVVVEFAPIEKGTDNGKIAITSAVKNASVTLSGKATQKKPTPTPTVPATPTATATPSTTATATPTATSTTSPPTKTATATPTATSTSSTPTKTATATPSTTATLTATATPTATSTSSTPTKTATATPSTTTTLTATATQTATATHTATATSTGKPSATPTSTAIPPAITISGRVVLAGISGGTVTPVTPLVPVTGAPVWLEAIYVLTPTPTPTATPSASPTPSPSPSPTPTPAVVSSPLYLIQTTVTDSSGDFSFTDVPTYGAPISLVVVTDSNSLPTSGSPPSDATVTGPLTPGGLLTGLEIPLIPATNSNANSLQGMFWTENDTSPPGAGDDVTFAPAQPVAGGFLFPGYIGTLFDVDALVPPLAAPNGSTNGTQNGAGGAPYLTTSTTGSANGCGSVSCPASTNCACFSMAAPNGNPVAGAPSTSGTGYTQPNPPPEGCEDNPAACYTTYFWPATLGSLSPTQLYGNPDCPDYNALFCTGKGELLSCCTGIGTGTCYFPTEQPDMQSPFQLDELSSVTDVPAGNLPSALGAFMECQ